MTSAVGLVVYALLAVMVVAPALQRAGWTSDMPRLGIAAWQSLTFSVVLAAILAGVGLTLGLSHISLDLASVIDMCAANLRHEYQTPGGGPASLAGAALSTLVILRLSWSLVRRGISDRSQRRRTGHLLHLVGYPSAIPGAIVLDHDVPYAFCLPGRGRRVVITKGLLVSLEPSELEAVLAHERGHLRSRHHATMLLANSMADAFSRVIPIFRTARDQIATLVEMSADDIARRQVGDVALRNALGRLAPMPAPQSALAASAAGVEHRLDRLNGRDPAPQLATRSLVIASVVTATLAPLAIAFGPAIATMWDRICLIS